MGHAENKRQRQEAIVLLLTSAKTGYSSSELAARLGCNESTIRRDFDELRKRYEFIQTTKDHYCIDPMTVLHNVSLHPSEALMIYLSMRRMLRQMTKAPQFMLSAIQKITPALRRPDLIENLNRAVIDLRQRNPITQQDTAVWQALIRGWLEKRVVSIRYEKLSGESYTTDIEPLLFEPMVGGDSTYIVAWSDLRKDIRTFKLDRIRRAIVRGETFEPRPLDIDQLIARAWGIDWGDEDTQRIVLRFSPHAATRVMESVYHPTEQKVFEKDGSLLWTAEIGTLREIKSWIRGWSYEAEVLEPQSLREEIIADLRAVLDLYEENN